MGKGECCCCLSFFVFLVGFAAFIIGTASPRWYVMDVTGDIGDMAKWLDFDIQIGLHTGVFFSCVEVGDDIVWDPDTCGWNELADSDTWWQVSAGLLAGTVLFGLIALFVAMVIPVTAGLQLLAGGLGIGGSVLWMVKMMDLSKYDEFDKLADVDARGQWGFILAVAGSALMFLNGIFLTIFACCNDCRCVVCCCCPRKSRY